LQNNLYLEYISKERNAIFLTFEWPGVGQEKTTRPGVGQEKTTSMAISP
jgi:hypothetical protein